MSVIEIPVREDVEEESQVFVVQATDRDSGDNGRVRYSLDDPTRSFRIDPMSGEITVARDLDYEQRMQHELAVTAHDLGTPRQQTMLEVIIKIQDVNDNAPEFDQARYSFQVMESVSTNTAIGTVTALDRDSGNNARITYIIQNGNHMDLFGIFADSGRVYTKAALDREARSQYTLQVVAVDSGIPSNSAMVEIQIEVLDANDNDPVFRRSSYIFYIEENKPSHTSVGIVEATDRDEPPALLYSMVSSSNLFQVDPASGEILTIQELNRESRDVHNLVIRVSDQGQPARTATVNVRIEVLDLNDNSPQFLQLGRYVAHVDEREPTGTLVKQVSARDPDKGENGTVAYSIVTGR